MNVLDEVFAWIGSSIPSAGEIAFFAAKVIVIGYLASAITGLGSGPAIGIGLVDDLLFALLRPGSTFWEGLMWDIFLDEVEHYREELDEQQRDEQEQHRTDYYRSKCENSSSLVFPCNFSLHDFILLGASGGWIANRYLPAAIDAAEEVAEFLAL